MNTHHSALISVVVPVFNEAEGITIFTQQLKIVLDELSGYSYEIIYCDDGSTDKTVAIITDLATTDPHIRLVALSRNFGKEYALTAGIAEATGDCIMTLDGDGQHPVQTIPDFIAAWEKGAQVVIGVRARSADRKTMKGLTSKAFYRTFNQISGEHLVPGSTDFRLLDREVQTAFLQLSESSRITRGLIDWLGFERTYITFEPHDRAFGHPTYGLGQLIQLGVNSFVSLSLVPLYIFGYIGVAITVLSGVLGLAVIIEQAILHDPLGWRFTGTAMLGILILFLVGIILVSQGILSLYVSRIHLQSKHRPLYIINHKRSIEKPKK